MTNKILVEVLGFTPKNGTVGVFSKQYSGYVLEVDFTNERFNYGDLIKAESKTTQNFSQPENWVVFECVDRLLEKGYQPQNITLEKTWPTGHGTSGRLDIFVTNTDGSAYLMIECKTVGKEYDKELKSTLKDGGQLFTYFQQDRSTEFLMLYASECRNGKILYNNSIIKIEDDYRQTANVKDLYELWNKLPKDNGMFDSWTTPYHFVSKALTPEALKEITEEDSGKIFNRFLEILRHNVVSDKPNAFNKIFTLFLCKIYDESQTLPGQELRFQWLEGKDDDISFQMRLTDLYGKGMSSFLEKEVTDFSKDDFENEFGNDINDSIKERLLLEFTKIRLMKNNEFAIKEVFDQDSFKDNGKVVKEVVELLQGYKIRYTKKQQYLSDFFELLLTTGLKQESGQFFTPVPIAQFVIRSLPIDKMILEKLQGGEKDNLLPTMIDYAAGSGHFLTESMHVVQSVINGADESTYIRDTAKKIKTWKNDHFEWAKEYVYGIEKDYRLVKVGKVGCYLHGDGIANVVHSDGLGNFVNTKEYTGRLKQSDGANPQDNRQFDIVISNPPYSVSAFRNNARKFYGEEDFELYNKLTDQSSEIECLFIERTKQLLKDGGVAGIILPSSILSNSGIYTKTREIILRYFEILGIAELGSNTFMATGTNTVTLFLRRRKNRFAKDIENSIESFAASLQDATITKIEAPITKYVSHVWEGISFADYKTIFQKSPNNSVKNHEIYQEYTKKIRVKDEIELFDQIIIREKEKLLYFVLAYPQKLVLVKSATGENKDEKAFLGYEFSNRRGSEGIHPIQRGKKIDDCTKLYDPEQFENSTKASTYIYDAFNGDFDREIDGSLTENICRVNLVELLAFDRVDFEKSLSLTAKKKVEIESRWDLRKLGDIAQIIAGQSPQSEYYNDVEDGLPFYQGKLEFTDVSLASPRVWTTKITKESELGDILMSVRAPVGDVNLNPFDKICIGRGLCAIRSATEKLLQDYLWIYLRLIKDDIVLYGNQGATFQAITKDQIDGIKIPLPPKDIQKKIIAEIVVLEKFEKKIKTEVEGLKQELDTVVDAISGNLVMLKTVTSKIGSGATPRGGEGSYKTSGITLIRSQNIYDDGFRIKGLAFIDEVQAAKLSNVAVEENDVLLNITGASIARCCMADPKYLPARVNQHVAIIRANKKLLPKFLHHILISDQYKTSLLSIGDNGATREALTKSQLEEFKIPVPPLVEQKLVVHKIEKIEFQLAKLEKELSTLPAQKEAILKKYL